MVPNHVRTELSKLIRVNRWIYVESFILIDPNITSATVYVLILLAGWIHSAIHDLWYSINVNIRLMYRIDRMIYHQMKRTVSLGKLYLNAVPHSPHAA